MWRQEKLMMHGPFPFLGGDSKTLMFVQISPNENDLSETLCSLNFASRVKGIELGPAKKQFDSSELVRYKQLVRFILISNLYLPWPSFIGILLS